MKVGDLIIDKYDYVKKIGVIVCEKKIKYKETHFIILWSDGYTDEFSCNYLIGYHDVI